MRNLRSRRSIVRVATCGLALCVLACRKGGDADEHVQAVVGARMAVVTPQPFVETIGAIGVVSGRPGHIASLAAPLPARVARVLVGVGQHIAVGTVLVELDQTSFGASARSAEAALVAATQAYERTKRLADEGIAPRKDVEQAAAELEKARGEAENARRQQELSVLRAPIGGVVTRVNATLGAMVDPSQVLIEIADPGALDILFSVTPTQAALVQRGAKVTLSAGQSASGEPLGVASVADVGGIVDTLTRAVTIRAQAPTTRRPLRIGETVFGQIVTQVQPQAIVIPIEALVPDGEEFKVFVVDAAGMAHARSVTVGARTGTMAEITSGLAAGERIVTYGAYGIEDSAKVVPIGTPAKP